MEVKVFIYFYSSALAEGSLLNERISLALIFLKLHLDVFRLRQDAIWIVVVMIRQIVIVVLHIINLMPCIIALGTMLPDPTDVARRVKRAVELARRVIPQFLELQPHVFILLLHLLDVVVVHGHLSKPLIFVLKDVQLLADVAAFLALGEQLLQVLHLFLQLLDQRVVLGVDLVSLEPLHHTLRAVCELQGRDRLLDAVDNWGDRCYEVGRGVAADGVLEQTG